MSQATGLEIAAAIMVIGSLAMTVIVIALRRRTEDSARADKRQDTDTRKVP